MSTETILNAKFACTNYLAELKLRLEKLFGACNVAYVVTDDTQRLRISRVGYNSVVTYYINDDGSWNAIDSPDSVDNIVYDWVAAFSTPVATS